MRYYFRAALWSVLFRLPTFLVSKRLDGFITRLGYDLDIADAFRG